MRRWPAFLGYLLLCMLLQACEQAGNTNRSKHTKDIISLLDTDVGRDQQNPYVRMRESIRKDRFNVTQMHYLLDDPDIDGLCNSILHFYLMHEEPGVTDLLESLWQRQKDNDRFKEYPQMNHEAAQVTLAHTLGRIHPDQLSYLGFIRTRSLSREAITRARVAIALGDIGDDSDLPALLRLAQDQDDHVAGAGIRSLARLGSEAAIQGLQHLQGVYQDNQQKQAVIQTAIQKASNGN